ncbi:MAG: endonuclease/exonuclease/phosphatase family protein [Nocardioides sp.]
MVRRVLLGRRDDGSRALRWAGPPRLLVLATVAAFVVVPLVDDDRDPPAQVTNVAAHSPGTPAPRRALGPTTVRPEERPASVLGGTAARGIAPVQPKPVRVGVASLNMFRKLTVDQARRDALTLTRRPAVDVVGWQEAQRFGSVLRSLPGWQSRTFAFGGGTSELAVSWRAAEFRLVSARQQLVARGVSAEAGRYPFGGRLVAVVTLAHRDTGRLLTVVNTHLPQAIEDLERPGHWTETINAYRARQQLQRLAALWKGAPGRWVVGTGDFNFDAGADARNRPAGGPRRALERTAVSSYQELGTDVAATFPAHGRRIDYVWADREAYDAGRMRFAGQWVLSGLNSDHHALVASVVLS